MAAEDVCSRILTYLKERGAANTFRLARDLRIPRGEVLTLLCELEEDGAVKSRSGIITFCRFPRRDVSARAKPQAPRAAEPSGMEESIIAALRKAPQGRSLAELASAVGVHFVRLAPHLRALVETGRVRKKGKVYALLRSSHS